MEIGLIVLAIILATLLGWLLKQSFNTQPWVAEEVSETAHHGPLMITSLSAPMNRSSSALPKSWSEPLLPRN